MEIFCFFSGVLFVYTGHVYLLLALAALCFIRWRKLWVGLFILGGCYAMVHQWWVFSELPVSSDVIPRAEVTGQIISIPNVKANKTQFHFRMYCINGQKIETSVLLSWYQNAPDLMVGEHWQLTIKLKKPHNLNNPGGFDYRQWLSARHIQWTGFVKHGNHKRLAEKKTFFNLTELRQRLSERISAIIPDKQVAGIMQALTLGITEKIDSDLWELFRRTGTTHLMVISGAHVGFIAGLLFLISKWLWRRTLWCVTWPAIRVAGLAGFVAAFFYALLAGFAVPAQRALIGCAFFMIHCLGNRQYSVWQIWRYAVLLVIMFEPHAVLMPGFYLSFIAVSLIIIANQRWRVRGLKKIFLTQAACGVGLLPLSLFWFSYGSLNGFIANLFAIPLIGFCIVPLALFTLLLISCQGVGFLVTILSLLVTCLLKLLMLVDSLSFFNVDYSFHQVLIPFSLMLALIILVTLPARTFQLAALTISIVVMFTGHTQVKKGDAYVYVLDVGQGLAVVVQTAQHVLIYDTGDKFYQGSDMGKLAILPFLQTQRIKHIDKVVISHPDRDHKGGLKSLEANLPIKELIVNDRRYYHRGLSCHQFKDWQWDGVKFHFFPIRENLKGKNNRSCILRIDHPEGQMLLTGDIEQSAEAYLVKTYGKQLKSTVLLVAHHGSKTSSSKEFLDTVRPDYAIASMGYDNRFHFPHSQIVKRYKQLHIPLFSTKECGMTTIKFRKNETLLKPECYTPRNDYNQIGVVILRNVNL